MGVYKLSANSVKNGRTIYGSMLAGNTAFVNTSFESIATVTVGSGGAANVEFTSIPSTYTHLQIRGISQSEKSSSVDYFNMRINGDTGNNYTLHLLYGNGSSAGTYATSNDSKYDLSEFPAASSTNIFGGFIMDILDYRNTNKYKTIKHIGNNDRNGAGQIGLSSGLWMSTSAITSLRFYFSANDISQYSHFALYGIKEAV